MATESITAIRHTCDGCGGSTCISNEKDLPSGYHGKVSVVHFDGTGVGAAKFYACRPICIQSAVMNAIVEYIKLTA